MDKLTDELNRLIDEQEKIIVATQVKHTNASARFRRAQRDMDTSTKELMEAFRQLQSYIELVKIAESIEKG